VNAIAEWLLNRCADVFDVASTVVDHAGPWILLAPAVPVGAWLAGRQLWDAARWLTREMPDATDSRDGIDGFDPADVDELAIRAADYAALEAVGPPAIDTQPAPPDDLSRELDAAYYADAINARKETEQ